MVEEEGKCECTFESVAIRIGKTPKDIKEKTEIQMCLQGQITSILSEETERRL